MTVFEGVDSLPAFLERAYDRDRLADLVRENMLRSSQRLVALVPVQGHSTKDDRLLVAYRVEIDSGDSFAPTNVPVYLHYAMAGRVRKAADYRDSRKLRSNGCFPVLKRSVVRLGESMFLSAFPVDPELKLLRRLSMPKFALRSFNRAATTPGLPAAHGLTLSLIGYRPEKRAVFRMRTVTDEGVIRTFVWKIYRKNEAERIWGFCSRLSPALARGAGRLAAPVSVDPPDSALLFPYFEGTTLHALLEQGRATGEHLGRAGKLLRALHKTPPPLESDAHNARGEPFVHGRPMKPKDKGLFRSFCRSDELAILDRWRRLLKKGNHPASGQVARYLKLLQQAADPAEKPDTLVHRDFYPKQVLFPGCDEAPVLLDVDTMAMGPPAIDVGNFLAHLELARLEAKGGFDVKSLRRAFLKGYGADALLSAAVAYYELSTLVRLFCLAVVSPRAAELAEPLARLCRKLSKRIAH